MDDFVANNGYNSETRITTIYVKGTDSIGNTCILKKENPLSVIEVPKAVIVAASKSTSAATNQILKDISSNLGINNVATSLMDISTGTTSSVESNSADAATIFNSWGRIGLTGKWSYSNGIITNAENTNNYTGFYYPNKAYQEITFSFNNRTTDGDDDFMGCMFKFNKNANGTVTTYLFALDRHDNGGGISNGAYNGLLKITNGSFAHASVTKLYTNSSLVWSRNTWTNYKIVTSDNNIKVYIDGVLKIDYTDPNPIKTGSYGFFSYSQAYSQFKDISASGYIPYTLADIVQNTSFISVDNNIIINISNDSEPLLQQQSFLDLLKISNIHYIGIGSTSNQAEIEQFIAQNNNNGLFVDSANYDNAIEQVAQYIMNVCK